MTHLPTNLYLPNYLYVPISMYLYLRTYLYVPISKYLSLRTYLYVLISTYPSLAIYLPFSSYLPYPYFLSISILILAPPTQDRYPSCFFVCHISLVNLYHTTSLLGVRIIFAKCFSQHFLCQIVLFLFL